MLQAEFDNAVERFLAARTAAEPCAPPSLAAAARRRAPAGGRLELTIRVCRGAARKRVRMPVAASEVGGRVMKPAAPECNLRLVKAVGARPSHPEEALNETASKCSRHVAFGKNETIGRQQRAFYERAKAGAAARPAASRRTQRRGSERNRPQRPDRKPPRTSEYRGVRHMADDCIQQARDRLLDWNRC